ncbi:MAG: C1 family peptidase [Candidatus Aminicenantes bacterium]
MKSGSKIFSIIFFSIVILLMPFDGSARKGKKKEKAVYEFEIITEVKRTPVKDQYWTGTCWCFSTISFLESELLRNGKEAIDLSEMYVVRRTYPHKAMDYIRMHGRANHSQGGQSHDVIDQIRRYGIVPENVYPGMNIEEKRHNHGEMSAVLNALLEAVLKRRGKRVTPRWLDAYNAVLDVYLGKPPTTFTYKGKSYTPHEFAAEYLGLNPDDYIELTSYTHHPFYKQCRLELPDNWTYNDDYYNVPIDDLERIVDHVLKSGYSLVWDGDVSERDFSSREKGYAIVPEKDWENQTEAEKKKEITAPVKEKEVTQEMRQKTYDNFTTTDDHLMHIVGIAKDQVGTKFYLTKNSGGTDRKYGGYVYMSRSYFRLKTTAIMINKHSLPEEIKTKLGIN